jgi:hypothetical protein
MIEYLSETPESVVEDSTANNFQILLMTENGNYFYSPNGFVKAGILPIENAFLSKKSLVKVFDSAVELAKKDFISGNIHIVAIH